MRKDAEALEELDIERVDGVDDPATGRPFLFAKSADFEDLDESLQSLGRHTRKTLRHLAKSGKAFDRDTVLCLRSLAKAVDSKAEFRIAKSDDETEKSADANAQAAAAAAAAGAAPAAKAEGGELAAALKSLAEGQAAMVKSMEAMAASFKAKAMPDDEEDQMDAAAEEAAAGEDEEETEKAAALAKRRRSAQSDQADDDDDSSVSKGRGKVTKMGQGLFKSVVFSGVKSAARR